MSIRNKIIACIIFSICMTAGGLASVAYWQADKIMTKNFESNAAGQLQRMNAYISLYMENAKGLLAFVSGNPQLLQCVGNIPNYIDPARQPDNKFAALSSYERELTEEFSRLSKAFPAFESVYMASADGGILLNDNSIITPGFDPRTRPWYTKSVQAAGKIVVSDSYVSVSKAIVYTVAKAVYDAGGKCVGVFGIDMNISKLTAFFDTVSIGNTAHIIVVDQSDRIIADADDPKRLFKKVNELGNPSLQAALSQKSGMTTIILDGVVHITFMHVTPEGWRLLLLIEASEVHDASMTLLLDMLLLGGGIMLVLAVLGWFMARSIVMPINSMVVAAQEVAGGDFSAVSRNVSFKGELRHLHNSLVQMVSQLGTFIETANSKTAEAESALLQGQEAIKKAEEAQSRAEGARREGLQEAAAQLQVTTEQLNVVTGDLSTQIQQAQHGADDQRSRVGETVTALEEMQATVAEVAQRASEAAESSSAARSEAGKGADIVRQVVQAIGSVNEKNTEMGTNLNALGQQATGIGHVMSVISDIADQTNLLALNAAIEAARAGEAGRGFAVVADEVRKLAEKTMAATKEVGEAIKAIQNSSNVCVKGMQESFVAVEQSTQLAHVASEALGNIVNLVQNSSDQIRAIATASEQQSATTEEINKGAMQINTIAQSTAAAMDTSMNAVQELARSTNELNTLVNNLKNA